MNENALVGGEGAHDLTEAGAIQPKAVDRGRNMIQTSGKDAGAHSKTHRRKSEQTTQCVGGNQELHNVQRRWHVRNATHARSHNRECCARASARERDA